MSTVSRGDRSLGTLRETSSAAVDKALSIGKPVKIGTITSKNPTVSNLLMRNPVFKKDCWNIIYARQNRDKAYTEIPTGTDIYYDQATQELLWGDMIKNSATEHALASRSPASGTPKSGSVVSSLTSANKTSNPVATGPDAGTGELNEALVDAVLPMIGSAYSDMNCYELLVKGLNKMGVRYHGQEGLGHQLVAKAMKNGLPMNAYLNGEGLVRFSGSETYRKTFLRVSDPVRQARQVIREMSGHLEKGSILSFSMESRGHTGIVSNKNGNWTYINSGVMDHSVGASTTSKGVGEESLDKEIENWFRLAARKHESLVITLGNLNRNKLAAYETGRERTIS